MKRYLLDTNHLSEAVGKVSVVRDHVQQLQRQGIVFGTCGPVLCELMAGIVALRDKVKARTRLELLLQIVRIWPWVLTSPINMRKSITNYAAKGACCPK